MKVSDGFWDPHHFDLSDALNDEIWRRSPDVQLDIDPPKSLTGDGLIGAQQAMIDTLPPTRPLPWVPDLVGRDWRDEKSLIVVGAAYAGFIAEYSTRRHCLSLRDYGDASSVSDFQRRFLEAVVVGDENYYGLVAQLCTLLGGTSRLTLMDLCRVSLVQRRNARGASTQRADSSASSVYARKPSGASGHIGGIAFEKYSETSSAREWTWRRLHSGRAKCVVALGLVAEHGLLRLFDSRGMTITEGGRVFRPPAGRPGEWVGKYADATRNIGYWRSHRTWWTVAGSVDGMARQWFLLPVWHPGARRNAPASDRQYELSRRVLELMIDKSA